MFRLQRTRAAAIFCLLILSGCATSGSPVNSWLDPVTGVTVTNATTPLVFFRDNSAQAAHAREFVYVSPVEVNRMGDHSYYLWLGIWTTVDRLDRAAILDGFETIVIYADGEPVQLDVVGWSYDAVGVSEPVFVKPVANASEAYYQVTRDQVRWLAQAMDIRVQTQSSRARYFEPWDSQDRSRAGVAAFLESTGR